MVEKRPAAARPCSVVPCLEKRPARATHFHLRPAYPGQAGKQAGPAAVFIYQALEAMQQELVTMGSSLAVYHGYPVEVFDKLLQQFDIGAVFTNHDYEPYAIERDALVGRLLSGAGVLMYTYKDQVIFEKNEVLKDDGKPYTVFTPYSRKWKTLLNDFYLRSYPDSVLYDRFYRQEAMALPSLSQIGFEWRGNDFPSKTWDLARMQQYGATRDFPAMDKGTSRLGVHLRFGTISIRNWPGRRKLRVKCTSMS